jgi:hypothetical protein
LTLPPTGRAGFAFGQAAIDPSTKFFPGRELISGQRV